MEKRKKKKTRIEVEDLDPQEMVTEEELKKVTGGSIVLQDSLSLTDGKISITSTTLKRLIKETTTTDPFFKVE